VLRQQLTTSLPRQARKLTLSTLSSALRQISLPSLLSTIKEGRSRAPTLPFPTPVLLALQTLPSAPNQRSSSPPALITERRPLLRLLTQARGIPCSPTWSGTHVYGAGSYNHGSADNIGVITQFMCDALTNTCGANQAAVDQCKGAQAAANAATPPQTGVEADGSCLRLFISCYLFAYLC